MKYLVMMRPRDQYFSLPGSVIRQILTSAKDKLKQQEEQGKLEFIYWTYDGGDTVVQIYECESHDELVKCINEIPAAGLFEITVYPLANCYEAINAALENLEIADDMQPGGAMK